MLAAKATVVSCLSADNQTGHEPDVGLWPVRVLFLRLSALGAADALALPPSGNAAFALLAYLGGFYLDHTGYAIGLLAVRPTPNAFSCRN
jgi:hypothetical protein